MATTTKPVFVLAPGAWHQAAPSYAPIIPQLQSAGYEVHTVEYPSVGAEPPTKTMYDDADAVRAVLAPLIDAGRKVVLVVHSYGGLVGAEAVRGLDEKQKEGILLLVYLSAFVTPKGLSILQMLGGQPLPWMDFQGEHVYAKTPEEIFYHDVPAALQKTAIANLRHQSAQVFRDQVTYEPWHDVQCMYFFCDEDRALLPPVQTQLAAALGERAITFTAKGRSHSPFLSAPDEVVEGLLYGVAEAEKRASSS